MGGLLEQTVSQGLTTPPDELASENSSLKVGLKQLEFFFFLLDSVSNYIIL